MQVVFLGLETLLPLMSLELLKFPKLSCLYFQLLAHMLEVSTQAAPWQHSTHVGVLRFHEVLAHSWVRQKAWEGVPEPLQRLICIPFGRLSSCWPLRM